MAKCSKCGQAVTTAQILCEQCNGVEGFKDCHNNTISVGDRLRSIINGMIFTLKFGWFPQWCALDEEWMFGCGYYCESEAGGQYPIGKLAEWAEKIQ